MLFGGTQDEFLEGSCYVFSSVDNFFM